jgi:hypothetical protein
LQSQSIAATGSSSLLSLLPRSASTTIGGLESRRRTLHHHTVNLIHPAFNRCTRSGHERRTGKPIVTSFLLSYFPCFTCAGTHTLLRNYEKTLWLRRSQRNCNNLPFVEDRRPYYLYRGSGRH